MSRAVFDRLMAETRTFHQRHPDTASFCPFPDDLEAIEVEAHLINAARLFMVEDELEDCNCPQLRDACLAAAPFAKWRETYRHTGIGGEFLERFACYALIGPGGAFSSSKMGAYFVYMPKGLHYPWHHHPAEELYTVLAGSAEFHLKDNPTRQLSTGETSFHASNRPHAMTTVDTPVLAYVLLRGDLETLPVWSHATDAETKVQSG